MVITQQQGAVASKEYPPEHVQFDTQAHHLL